jgi:multiple sugar transport system ATP-binding protein
MASLNLQAIRKTYDGGSEIIKGIDLSVADGEFMVFVGPSGCGKSTLLRMIAGLEEISDGELRIDGRRVNEVPPAERGIAMVFQSYALYPHMSVAANMGFALTLAGQSKAQVREAVGRAAEVLQISHLLDRKPKALSGGQRQRVAIGRAIVRKPKVFLFDEPLSNLDAALRVQMRAELARLHRELGTTMVYVTHDQVEAMTLGQRIAVFNGGCIEQVGAPMDLYDRPANLFVAGFLGSPKMNLLPTRVLPPAWQRTGDMLGFRPDQVELAGADGDDDRRLGARVELVERLGDATLVHLQCSGHDSPVIVRLSGHATPVERGSRVSLQPDLARACWFDAAGRAVSAAPALAA